MPKSNKSAIETGEVSGASQYVPLTDAEIKELAVGVIHDKVFGTWMIDEQDVHLIPSIFMVVALMDDIQRKEMKRDEIIHLYEWMKNAGPRSINGFPMFMSARMMNRADADRLQTKIDQIKEALSAI